MQGDRFFFLRSSRCLRHLGLRRVAGVQRRVAKDDPRLVVTEHPRKDGTTLVVAVNTHDKPSEFPVTVAGKVGRVWNGEWGTGNGERFSSARTTDACSRLQMGIEK